MLLFLLGVLVTVLAGVAANLLTPFAKPLWAWVRSVMHRSERATIEQEIRTRQAQLKQLDRFRNSDRDLYLYLFQWLLGIATMFVAAVGCAILAATTLYERLFLNLSFLFLIF